MGDDLDEVTVWARAHGPAPLALDGWDYASIWGWDEATGSLYARLWANTDDPAKPPTIKIGPDDFTPAIIFPETLAQHIAMAVDCSPWDVITALDMIVDQDEDWASRDKDARASKAGTVVSMTEGCEIWWPPHAQETSGS
jgi:hypothetical protein